MLSVLLRGAILYTALYRSRFLSEDKATARKGIIPSEPTDPADLEPDTRNYGPGAMTVGEIDTYDGLDCEEF